MSLTWHNLKKAKGEYISFGLIIILVLSSLSLALSLAFQTFKAYDARFYELNSGEVNFYILEDVSNLQPKIAKIESVSQIEKTPVLMAEATVKDFKDSDFDMNTVFYNLDNKRRLNQYEIIDAANISAEKYIMLPEYMHQLGGFDLNDKIEYKIGDQYYTYPVKAIISEMEYGNYGNGLMGAYLSATAYKDLSENVEEISEYSLKTTGQVNYEKIKDDITKIINDEALTLVSIKDWQSNKESRTMVAKLVISIFIAFAGIILILSLLINNFRIKNTIEEEIVNMGALKALGYKSGQIIKATVLPYILVMILAAVIALSLSYFILPILSSALAVQSGFRFEASFDVKASLIAFFTVSLVIILISYISASKIRKLDPILALRGQKSRKEVKNRLALSETRVSLSLRMLGKRILTAKGQNILLFFISFALIVLLTFAGNLLYNINIKPENLRKTLSEESPEIVITVKDGEIKNLKKELKSHKDIETVLEYGNFPLTYANGSLTAFVSENFSLLENDICYQGRNPQNSNEVALGSALADDYNIGDTIEISQGTKKKEYKVTGYIQSVNSNGKAIHLTKDAYKKLSGQDIQTLNVYLKDGVDTEKYINALESSYGGQISSTLNYEKLSQAGTELFASVSAVTALGITIFSIILVILFMYIIIKAMIMKERRELGIYKAIGYSNHQLIFQMAGSFMPVIIIASFLSTFAATKYIAFINKNIFSSLGAIKNHFQISLPTYLIIAVCFCLVAFVISLLLSLSIRKIEAYNLLKAE